MRGVGGMQSREVALGREKWRGRGEGYEIVSEMSEMQALQHY